jgi:hypothetical protein
MYASTKAKKATRGFVKMGDHSLTEVVDGRMMQSSHAVKMDSI